MTKSHVSQESESRDPRDLPRGQRVLPRDWRSKLSRSDRITNKRQREAKIRLQQFKKKKKREVN